MSTATIERQATITAAEPLTDSETTSLITLAASTERIARVKSNGAPRTSRGWSLLGDVD